MLLGRPQRWHWLISTYFSPKGTADFNIGLSKIDGENLYSSDILLKGQISDEGLNASLKADKIQLKTFNYFTNNIIFHEF